MSGEKEIYNHHAGQYELLVSREDYQHNILPALNQIRPFEGLDVVEMGAGTSGWSICYMVVWHKETWQAELGKALAEMKRVLRPGGTIIILETLGTGKDKPDTFFLWR